MINRALLLFLVGAAGGLLAWAFVEPFAPKDFYDSGWGRFESILALVSGLLIGGGISGLSGYYQGSRTHALRGLLIGAGIGALVGPFAISIGSAALNLFSGPVRGVNGLGTIGMYIGRIVGWALFGGVLGLAEGAIGRSGKRALQGLIGGLLGGGLGGWAFQLTADLLGKSVITVRGGNESGSISRAIGLTVTGAGIGLLIGLVEALSRQAWVRLILGRNEGKEWPIDTDSTALGRDERAQIPLFGDPNVASLHALIVKQKGFYYLVDQGSPIGIALNGQRVQNAQLAPGDHIQIGSHQLEFQLRDGQVARASREARMHAVPIQGVPMQPMQQPMPQQPTMAQTQAYMPSVAPSQPTVAFAPQAMSLSLVATNGPIAGQRFPVVGNLIIGRESAGITLGFDTMASRNHAEISPSGEIRDLGSTNGTLVNGAKIQSTNLKVGDVVQVGATTFRVE